MTTPESTATQKIIEDALGGVRKILRVAVETEHQAMIVLLVLTGAGASLPQRGFVMASVQYQRDSVVSRRCSMFVRGSAFCVDMQGNSTSTDPRLGFGDRRREVIWSRSLECAGMLASSTAKHRDRRCVGASR